MMTSKERVLHAVRRDDVPDRVPLQFDLCESLLEKFSRKHGLILDYQHSYYEDLTYRIAANDLRTAMGSDVVVVGGTAGANFTLQEDEQGVMVNEFGMEMRKGPFYMDIIKPPLGHISSLEEAQAYSFPDPTDPARYIQAEKDITRFKDDYFIIGDCEVTIFAMVRQLLGMEKFLVDVMLKEAYMAVLLEKAFNWSLGVSLELVRRGADAVWFGDDFGTQESLIMSAELWREMFKPLYANLIKRIRAVKPDVIIIQHSDGAVAPLLGDFIEIGIDVFNPVQPNVPGHGTEELEDRFGKDITFFGAIDQQYLLPRGTPEEIEADVQEKMRVLGRDGGYIIAPAHIIQADTPVENVEAFIGAVKKYGGYT